MKTPHPIDDLFNSQLHDLEMAPPMHLWEKIAPPTRPANPAERRRSLLLCGLLAVALSQLVYSDAPNTAKKINPTASSDPIASQDRPAVPAPTASDSDNTLTPLPSASLQQTTPSRRRSKRPLRHTEGALPLLALEKNTPLSTPTTSESKDELAESTQTDAPIIPTRPSRFESYALQDFMPGIRFLGERWFASLDMAYSQEWAQRTLLPNDPTHQSYADLRNTTEKFHSAHSAALRLSLIAASGLTLKSGIQVSTISETFSQTRSESKIILTPKTDPSGQIIGTDTSVQVSEFRWDSRNQLYTIDIPILIGYEFSKGQLNVGLTAGPLLNMAFNQQGSFIGPDGKNVLNFSSNQPDSYPAFKNRLGMGWYSSVQLSYPITPSIRVLAEPYLRAFPHDYTSYDYPLEQRYWAGGIFIGVRKLLGPYWLNLKP